jgi:hypothetical protein
MMGSPVVQAMMSNPDVMRNMIQSNPQLRAMAEANPQIYHVLNDPGTMQEMMRVMQNPVRHSLLGLSPPSLRTACRAEMYSLSYTSRACQRWPPICMHTHPVRMLRVQACVNVLAT